MLKLPTTLSPTAYYEVETYIAHKYSLSYIVSYYYLRNTIFGMLFGL